MLPLLLILEFIKCQLCKMVKHTQTIYRLLPTNCLTVFDHFTELAFKGLTGSPSEFHVVFLTF